MTLERIVRLPLLLSAALATFAAPLDRSRQCQDILSQDAACFTDLLDRHSPELIVEGIQGLSHLKSFPAEDRLLGLLDKSPPEIQNQIASALGRLGGCKSIPALIRLLGDASWELRQAAALELRRMTGQSFEAHEKEAWENWWRSTGPREKTAALLAAARGDSKEKIGRHEALRALISFAAFAEEAELLKFLTPPERGGLSFQERGFVVEALERAGTAASIPVLARERSDAAAWALARIGGPDAEKALLRFPHSTVLWLALDHLHSTNAAPFIPELVNDFGLVTFRVHPDDLMNERAQPIQRVAASLIKRSGLASLLIDSVLWELENTMQPSAPAASRPESPGNWQPMLQALREELKPGFVRGDGLTTSQPVVALAHLAEDPALAKRLVPLLRHPAFVPRIYVAEALAHLHARQTVPAILAVIREGYSFSDSTALASGKHFDQSQTVRWRGYLCMALGRMGGEPARAALEELAADPNQPRDIRYSSVAGLHFIGSSKSFSCLRKVQEQDAIWMVRDAARRAEESIALLESEKAL